MPGPACYRRGGPLTITDANVLLGRIQPQYFPRVFGRGADESLDRRDGRAALRRAGRADAAATAAGEPEQVAAGALQIAVAAWPTP